MDQSKILGESVGRYPLAYKQRDPDHIARTSEHVITWALRIKGELHIECLRGALDDVVERHESLRTRIIYSETDGSLGFQEVLPPLPVPLAVHEIPVIPGRSRDEIAADLLCEAHRAGLLFSVTPSLRASLHRFDDHDAVLTLLTHHLYGDGWSVSIICREIAACYRARLTGIPHALPAPAQYREFVSWEQEFLQGEKAAVARRFWLDKLAGTELYTMPADRLHGPDTLTPECAVGNFKIDPGNFAKVAASAAQNKCTVWHVFLAAFMVLAEKVSGQADITLLTVSSGRSARAFHDTIGFFTDLVPIRLEFGNCKSFLDLMLLARKASADALQNQIPFGAILEMFPDLMKGFADPWALLPGFNYISSRIVQNDIKFATSVGLVVPPEDPPGAFPRGGFKWNLRMVPPGELRCVVEYEPDAVDASTVERWGSDFIGLILAIADSPGRAWKNLQQIPGKAA